MKNLQHDNCRTVVGGKMGEDRLSKAQGGQKNMFFLKFIEIYFDILALLKYSNQGFKQQDQLGSFQGFSKGLVFIIIAVWVIVIFFTIFLVMDILAFQPPGLGS